MATGGEMRGVAVRLLELAFGGWGSGARFAAADLREERAVRGRRGGRLAASVWYWQEVVRVAVRVAVERSRGRAGRGMARSRGG